MPVRQIVATRSDGKCTIRALYTNPARDGCADGALSFPFMALQATRPESPHP